EAEDYQKEGFRVTSPGAFAVAKACAEIDDLCVYITTDYVFDGEKGSPYTESDVSHPINVYGASKLAGEYLVQQASPRSLVARMVSLFGKGGSSGKGGKFLGKILGKARGGETFGVENNIKNLPT